MGLGFSAPLPRIEPPGEIPGSEGSAAGGSRGRVSLLGKVKAYDMLIAKELLNRTGYIPDADTIP